MRNPIFRQRRKSYNILIVALTALSILNSCSNNPAVVEDSELYGLATPIQLTGDTTSVYLSDYFPFGFELDTIRAKGLDILYVDSNEIQLVQHESTELITNLRIFTSKSFYDIPVKKYRSYTHHFTFYDSTQQAQKICVKGSFNGWNEQQGVLQKDPSDPSKWDFVTTLPAGIYQYKFVVDGIEYNDPNNDLLVSNGMGGFNSQLNLPPVDKSATTPGGRLLKAVSYSHDSIYTQCAGDFRLKVYYENKYVEDIDLASNNRPVIIPPVAKNKTNSTLRIYSYNQNNFGNVLTIPLHNGKVVLNPNDLPKDDWHNSTMYFMMVDRFKDGNSSNNQPVDDPAILPKANYYGGDLAGITQKVKDGYFDSLNINTLWVSPITQNPTTAWGQFKDPDTKFSGYHGYWPISSSKIDHRFGTEAELKELLDVAHKNGMRVILDYVANHVHIEHPVYRNHPDWVTDLYLPDGTMNTERWDEYRLTTWFDTFMPSLNLMDQRVTDFMVDSAAYWIENYDFDGFRHDATKHIPNNFWRSLSLRVKEVSRQKNRHIYQIGETYGNSNLISSYLGSGLLDAQFDFNVYDKALEAFAKPESNPDELFKVVEESWDKYGMNHLMGNITGNQDKPRFISYADGSLSFDTEWMEFKRIGWKETIGIKDSIGYDRLMLFHAFNFAIPGIPIVYYGDEIGLPGAGDPDNRRMMQFGNLNAKQTKLKSKVSELARLRTSEMALLYGQCEIQNDQGVIIITRSYFDQKVTFYINLTENPFVLDNSTHTIFPYDFYYEIEH